MPMKSIPSLCLALVCLSFLCQCASNTGSVINGEGANQALDTTYKAARIANIARVLGS